MLDQARREKLVQGGVNFLGQDEVDAAGPVIDKRAAFRYRDIESYQGARIKSRLRLEENVISFSENFTQLFDD